MFFPQEQILFLSEKNSIEKGSKIRMTQLLPLKLYKPTDVYVKEIIPNFYLVMSRDCGYLD